MRKKNNLHAKALMQESRRYTLSSLISLGLLLSPSAAWSKGSKPSYKGDLDKLVSLMIMKGQSAAPYGFHFKLSNAAEKLDLHIKVYYSSELSFDKQDNRCTAAADNNEIYCDLRLVDGILKHIDMLDEKGSAVKYAFKHLGDKGGAKVALKWIVAHEIGHIVKRHGLSDYADPPKGLLIYDNEQQSKELEADKYSMDLIGNLKKAPVEDYQYILQAANALIRRALCPKTYPIPCSEVQPGAGLIYNSASDEPIKIDSGGNHPEYVARFVRILYLSGIGTNVNSINYLAKQVIDKFLIQTHDGTFQTAKEAMEPSKGKASTP